MCDTSTAVPARVDAAFETGIKFGSLYHQFVGTPVNPESAPTLARAIETSIENQPSCTDVTVDIRIDALRAAVEESPASYVEFTGRFFEATVTVIHRGFEVVARMEMTDGYPLMGIESIEPV